MQARSRKIASLFSFFLFFCVASGTAQRTGSAKTLLQQADSLFATGAYFQAGERFEQYLNQGNTETDVILLKLAYIQEKTGNIARFLYFLQLYYNRRPDEAVLKKMYAVASEEGLKGYETDDFNYFDLFYKQYGAYIILALLLLAIYAVVVFWMKIRRHELILRRHKLVMMGYLIGLLLLVNLPDRYQHGIIRQDRVLLRQQPAAAAQVVDVINKGHKVTILGSHDIWLRVFWNDGLYYVRKDAIWAI